MRLPFQDGGRPGAPATVQSGNFRGATKGAVRVVGVKRVADYLKRKLDGDAKLRVLSVRGEISNYRVLPNGRCYFDLKEEDAVLQCFAWPDDACRFSLKVRNGVAAVATGNVST